MTLNTEDATPTGSADGTPSAVQALSDTRVNQLRRDFPILDQEVNGEPLVYLDSGATAQRPTQVLEVERRFLENENAAVHRGAHTLAALSTVAFEDARETVAAFVGAAPEQISWTLNATDAINLVTGGIRIASAGRGGPRAARLAIGEGDEILITEAEHHANLVPWQELALDTGATLVYVPVNDRGTWSVEDAAALISSRTKVFAFAHVSNVTGLVADAKRLTELAHDAGAVVVLDACQSVPHLPVNFPAIGVDFAAFSGHKMLGPNGVGVLYGRAEMLDALPPARTGGSMISTVTMEASDFMAPPTRFEAGTQPVSQVVALAEAVRYLESVGMDAVAAHEAEMGQLLLAGLSGIPGVRIIGEPAGVPRAGLVSFAVEGVHSHDVTQFLDSKGVAVRGGHHCAQPLHRRLGLTASTRASSYLYTTREEIDRFVFAVGQIRGWFGVDA
ncbi:cysteine desulfurase [Pseudoclavibacter terrae]